MQVLCKAAAFVGVSFNKCHKAHKMTEVESRFQEHVADFGLTFGTPEEYQYRLELFADKDAKLNALNAKNGSFTVEHNKFSTWSAEEIKRMNGYKNFAPHIKKDTKPVVLNDSNLSADVDWRDRGAVSPVKNQGQCGSCWAFSTTGSVEGAYAISAGYLEYWSEQQLVDCAGGQYLNRGCEGGLMDNGFKYIIDGHALELEANYPYTAKDGKCQFDRSEATGRITGFNDVTPNSVSQLKAALEKGPVSVAIEADAPAFTNYKSGIIDGGADCGQQLDHGVLAVGYGEGYFIVKNSWGSDWGDAGFVKISDSADNICGILSNPSYPIA